ncbi:hypothetical protein WA026_022943 [Henosepilachna vigintioctopunctata]|uniref:Reverse transcriptase domain-containing protein n=1 Tax=Henosepilachna vigintioctopunctata TaxID=420089 RepID=A0AAW1U067_9CUCU
METFCNKINKSTPIKDVWNQVKHLKRINNVPDNIITTNSENWAEDFLSILAPPSVNKPLLEYTDRSNPTNFPEAIAKLLTGINLGLAEDQTIISCFLDISGAYDSVNIDMMYQDLIALEVPPIIASNILKLIINRNISSRINGHPDDLTSNHLSPADISVLSREVNMIKPQFNTDQELTNEADNLSQVLTDMISKTNNSIRSQKNILLATPVINAENNTCTIDINSSKKQKIEYISDNANSNTSSLMF